MKMYILFISSLFAMNAIASDFRDSCTDPQLDVGCRTDSKTGFCMAKNGKDRCSMDSGIGPRNVPAGSASDTIDYPVCNTLLVPDCKN